MMGQDADRLPFSAPFKVRVERRKPLQRRFVLKVIVDGGYVGACQCDFCGRPLRYQHLVVDRLGERLIVGRECLNAAD
jgi:hypothetical protein